MVMEYALTLIKYQLYIVDMKPPTNISELRCFMGTINQFGNSRGINSTSPWAAVETEFMDTEPCSYGNRIHGHGAMLVTKPTILTLFNLNAELKVSADPSSFGLGAVLVQKNSKSWQPVTFASRVMSDTECRYAQIEKEALAIPGHARNFHHIYWARLSLLRQTINNWSHY